MAQRIVLTVGPESAHLPGFHRPAIQAAIDHVAALGGGTVKLLPGRYELRNAVIMRAGVRLEGCGEETWLAKAAEVSSPLIEDTDWYESVVRVADPRGFQVGDGIVLQGTPPHSGPASLHKLKATVVAVDGHTLHLDRKVKLSYWTEHENTCSTLFPLIWIENVSDCAVARLRLDGNRAENGLLDGNHAGGVFMQFAERIALDEVISHSHHSDGFSWQVADDVTVTGCRSFDNHGLGFHPGSGSQRPVVRHCHAHHNDIGFFFCWGVKHGLVEHNRFEDNHSYGISIGHRDTDNLVRSNVIARNGKAGIYYRPEQPAVRLPHRNQFLDNEVVDNGAEESGCGFWLRDAVEGTEIRGNRFVDRGEGRQRTGVRIDAEVGPTVLEGNRFTGLTCEVEDARAAAATR
ncbi:MAG: right-handed parallel beta-helix repeat-containing protein [Armatimonadetes bacterium]|nr:right-handed parallel beta-helix repeat-containing protein [Armatimonadota bacterium]